MHSFDGDCLRGTKTDANNSAVPIIQLSLLIRFQVTKNSFKIQFVGSYPRTQQTLGSFTCMTTSNQIQQTRWVVGLGIYLPENKVRRWQALPLHLKIFPFHDNDVNACVNVSRSQLKTKCTFLLDFYRILKFHNQKTSNQLMSFMEKMRKEFPFS